MFTKELFRKCLCELLGTFTLIFCGTGVIIVQGIYESGAGILGVALVFGAVVTAMIYAFGSISGAHINPAVTIGFYVAKLLPKNHLLPYIVAQVLGAVIASTILALLFSGGNTIAVTRPMGSIAQSFVLEGIITFLLMLVILFTSQGSKEVGTMAGIAVGGFILLMVLFAGPVSGASMNPARSIAPAIISGFTAHLWLYIIAPILGACLAAWCFSIIRAH